MEIHAGDDKVASNKKGGFLHMAIECSWSEFA